MKTAEEKANKSAEGNFANTLLGKGYSFCEVCFNVSGLCVVALSINLKLTTTLDRAITQSPCYVPFLF